MAKDVHLRGGDGPNYHVKVTKFGQLVTAPVDYSTPEFKSITTTGVAVNFQVPVAGQQYVITDILINADRNVNASTPATIDIYEASAASATAVSKQILKLELLKNETRDITGQNIIVSQGVWLNAKSDDANILITINGYFVESNGK